MPEELGRYTIGVALELRDLSARVSTVQNLLQRVEKSVDSLDERAKKAGFGWLKGASQIKIAETAVNAVLGVIRLVPEALHKSTELFDETVRSAARYSGALHDQALIAGTNLRQAQALNAGLSVVAGTGELTTGVMLNLSRAIGAAAGGGGRISPKEAFKALGVEITDVHHRAKPFSELLDELAQKFNAIPEGPRRTAIATAIFRGEAVQMLKLFRELAKDGKTWQQSLDDLGLTIDERLLDAADRLDTQFNILKAQGEATFRLIGAEAAPAFEPLIHDLIDVRKQIINWVRDNREGIEELASTIVEKVRGILRMIDEMRTAFERSGPSMEDALVDAFNLMTLAVAKFVTWTGYAIQGVAGLAAAKNLLFNKGQISDTTLEIDRYARSLIDAGHAAQEAHAKEVTETNVYRERRDTLKGLREQIESLSQASSLPPDLQKTLDVENRLQTSLASAKSIIEALGPRYRQLTEEQRRFWEELGLHEKTVPEVPAPKAEPQGAPIPKFSASEIEDATKAIRKAIETAEQERIAIIGSTEAKIASVVASKEFAAATDQERTALQNALRTLTQTQEVQTRLQASAQAAATYATSAASKESALRQQQLQVALERAKREHDVQEEIRLTAALKEAALDDEITKERSVYNEMQAMRTGLDSADQDYVQNVLRRLEEVGIANKAAGDQEIAQAKDVLDTLLQMYQDYIDRRIAIGREAAKEEQRQIEDQRKLTINLRENLLSIVDDVNEGAILGTRKMSEVWKALWVSMEKQAERALVNTLYRKAGFDDEVEANFLHLPEKIAPGFDKIADLGKKLFTNLFSSKTAEEGGGDGWLTGIVRSIFGGAPAGANEAARAAAGAAVTPVEGGGAMTAAGTTPAIVQAGAGLLGGGGETAKPTPVTDLLTALIDTVRISFKDLGQLLITRLGSLADTVSGIGQSFLNGVKGLGSAIGKMAAGMIDGVVRIGSSIVDGLGGAIKGLAGFLSNGIDGLTTLINGVISIVRTIFTIVQSLITLVTTSIVTGLAGGATGGYITQRGRLLHAAGGAFVRDRVGPRGEVPIIAHRGEGILNARATEHLGGEHGIMALNRGLIPAAMLAAFRDFPTAGERMYVREDRAAFLPASPSRGSMSGGLGGHTSISNNNSKHAHFTLHPGAVVVHATAPAAPEDMGRGIIEGMLRTWNR